MEKKEPPISVERSKLTYQHHFHNMYRYLRDAEASKEDGARGTVQIWQLISCSLS
jgi:hypothetical protein